MRLSSKTRAVALAIPTLAAAMFSATAAAQEPPCPFYENRSGLCGYYPLPIMDKTHYKLQMVYPVPATAKEAGQCCQPYGRTTMIWGAGKSYPVSGEDFAYQIFRKRNCCATVPVSVP